MSRMEAPLNLLGLRRARLRARPSGVKGRCRDRCATDLRPALDPGASAGPDQAAVTGRRRALPAQRAAQTPTNQDQIPTTRSLRFEGIASGRLFGRRR
jgi:hypothetical protein